MTDDPDRPESVSQDDWDAVDVPEMTPDEFARAVPFAEAHPAHFTAWRSGREGRSEKPRSRLSLRMSADVVGSIKATGPGYSRRVEDVLRRALAKGELSER